MQETGIADICCVDVGKIIGVKTYDDSEDLNDDSGHMNTSAGNADILVDTLCEFVHYSSIFLMLV